MRAGSDSPTEVVEVMFRQFLWKSRADIESIYR